MGLKYVIILINRQNTISIFISCFESRFKTFSLFRTYFSFYTTTFSFLFLTHHTSRVASHDEDIQIIFPDMAQPNCKYVLDSKQIFLALKIRRNFSYASPLNAKRILRCCQKAVILVVFLHQLFILEIIQHHMLSHSSLNVAYVISKWTNIMKSTRCSLNRVLLTIIHTFGM